MKFNLTSTVLSLSDKVRPVLVKLLPMELLRRVKRGIVNSSMDKLSAEAPILPFDRTALPDGVNLIGYIQGETGLGQSCRLVAGTLQMAEVPFTVYDYNQVSAVRFNDQSWTHKITNTTPYNINLIHINPYELPLAFFRIGRHAWEKRYNIAFWLWELEQFPPSWCNALHLVDEIWTPSEFSSNSIRKVTNKPVHTIPYGIAAPDTGGYIRQSFGLPEDKFLFLCMYDSSSVMERKNPLGTINAYKRAFAKDDTRVGLVLKVNNAQPSDIKRIMQELDGYQGIFIISDTLDKVQVNGLIACVDTYCSLHRAEGFGLVPAEAMLLGTPVIATNWSSNAEFMDSGVACMVDYSLTTLTQDITPYKAGNRWAEPNINHASLFMKKLCTDDELCKSLANKAKSHITQVLAPERAAALFQGHLAAIYETSG